jgi:macrolide transport system ATP-binding/permease protein
MNPLKNLFKRPAIKREIDEELRFHIEQRTAENIAAGMSSEDAAREARKRFGNMQSVREECREARGAGFAETTLQDIRFGLRALRKNPGFTTVAVLSLALGIGVNIMMFSIFNALFLRPVPGVKDPGRIVSFKRTGPHHGQIGFPYSDYESYRDGNMVFSGMFAWIDRDARGEMVTIGDGPNVQNQGAGAVNPEAIPALLVSDNYFSVLGVRMALGRPFLPDQTRAPGAGPVVVLSHRLWQRRFGGDPTQLGKTIILNGVAFTVLGVAPSDFVGVGELRATDVWVPLTMAAELDSHAGWVELTGKWWFQMAGRLKPGVTIKQAEAHVKALHTRLAKETLRDEELPSLELKSVGTFAPLSDSLVLVLPVMTGVSLLLVIACANVANLLLARAAARRKEMGIRLAMGANRGRLIRQLMTESALMALAGGALGLLLGFWFCSWAWAFFQQSLPDYAQYLANLNVRPDLHTFSYMVLVSLLTAIVCGLAPALNTSLVDPAAALRDQSMLFGGPAARAHWRNFFAIAQVAACLGLLIGVGQLVFASRKASSVKFGYDPRGVVAAMFDFSRPGYPASRVKDFQVQLIDSLKALPGVERVSMAQNTLALNRHEDWVSPDYFETMAIPLLRGRTFTERDGETGAVVAIVSQATAERLWPGEDAIGKRLTNTPPAEIVGVVGNVRNLREVVFKQVLYTPALPGGHDEDFLYHPIGGDHFDRAALTVLVKTRNDPASVESAIRDQARRFDPSIFADVRPLTFDMQDTLQFVRILEFVTNLIGVAALVLAAMGIYGVMSYSVNQRRREIGIRMAVGAQRADVLRLFLRKGLWLVLGGVGLGFPAALAVSQVLSSVMIDLRPFEPLTFLLAGLCLGVAMFLACYLPARRATRIEPMDVLRCEQN